MKAITPRTGTGAGKSSPGNKGRSKNVASKFDQKVQQHGNAESTMDSGCKNSTHTGANYFDKSKKKINQNQKIKNQK